NASPGGARLQTSFTFLRQFDRPGVPDLDVALPVAGDEPVAVRAERDACGAAAAFELQDFPAGRCVPETQGPVVAGGGQATAIGMIRNACNFEGMTAASQEFLAGAGVPHVEMGVILPCA